jgi:hypothetical protein
MSRPGTARGLISAGLAGTLWLWAAASGGAPAWENDLTPIKAAVRPLVRWQQTVNDGMPEFDASGIFPSSDVVLSLLGNFRFSITRSTK